MDVTLTVTAEIGRHLDSLSLGQVEGVNEKLRLLLAAEYRRRLTRYHLTDRQLTQKYRMDFETFEQQQVTQQQDYTWEVESDAIAWETAVDGIRTVKRQLEEILVENNLI